MGRKPKKRRLAAKQRKGSTKPQKPDDYYRFGPFEMMRFGKVVVHRNTMTPDQFSAMQNDLVSQYPKTCEEINQTVEKIADIVKSVSPSELLKRAFWQMATEHMKVEREIDIGFKQVHAMRMIDYVQSVIAAVVPNESQEKDVTEERWKDLSDLVNSLFSRMLLKYQISRSAMNRMQDSDYNEVFETYKFKAQMYWCSVRGHRYLMHEIPFFRDVLLTHEDVIKGLYSITVDQILVAITQIHESLTRGIMKGVEDLWQFQQAITEKYQDKLKGFPDNTNSDTQELMSEVIRENGWQEWQDDICGRFFQLDLFDLQKITQLPVALLDELAWSPGQEKEFFSEGNFKGWPLRVWPIFKRPFLKLEGRYYCFDLYSLNDNFYRVIQRLIFRKNPDYKTEWNRRQKIVSESIPFNLFNKLLPGAKIFRSVNYKWHPAEGAVKNWCETDGLIIYEDHLFIVEIKAGAFTHTPPALDFDAYVESLKNLVLKPAKQGRRFLEYLNNAEKVSLFDSQHNEVEKIARKNFSYITICTITLDSFTELASQVNQMAELGIKLDDIPVWPLSIDDLRVYTDIFQNPLIFLHYVEQRVMALKSSIIRTEDELDHLGLYLKHNAYVRYAERLSTQDPIMWNGYRADIDRIFYEKLIDSTLEIRLEQRMPPRLREILNKLSEQGKPGRRKVSSSLLDCSGENRSGITTRIEEVLKDQKISRRPKPISLFGEFNLTIFCWQDGILQRDEELARDHVRAVMIGVGEKSRLLLEITFDSLGLLDDVSWEFMDLLGLSAEQFSKLESKATQLKQARLEKAVAEQGKIGRNESCPCGSSKKYKKCCGR